MTGAAGPRPPSFFMWPTRSASESGGTTMKRNLSLTALVMVLGLSGCPADEKDAVKSTPAASAPAKTPEKPAEATQAAAPADPAAKPAEPAAKAADGVPRTVEAPAQADKPAEPAQK